MGDSDDEMDFKRRDKFRSERRYDDDGPPGRRDWGGRDQGGRHGGPPATYGAYRRNHRRDSYSPESQPGRGRHEMSPPPKRARGNWDDDNGPPRQYRRQQQPERQEDGFQPAMMSFKAFLSNQDDTITDEEAIKKYAEYKLEFKRQQLNEFFVTHKAEEWFRQKYHPDDSVKRREEMTEALRRRVKVFEEFFDKGRFKEVSVDTDKQEKLVRLLDMVVIRLEGGTEEDFAVLDMPEEEEGKKVEGEKQEGGSEKGKIADKEKEEVVEKEEKDNSGGAVVENPPPKITDVGLENLKDDLDLSDLSDKEDNPENEEPIQNKPKEVIENGENEETKDGASEKMEEGDVETNDKEEITPPEGEPKEEKTEQDQKTEDGEDNKVSPAPPIQEDTKPKVLHKTTSIYLRNLAPTVTKQEVVAICKRYDGFLRCAISDPSPTNRWFRRGWITFNRKAKIKEICFNLNNIRLRDCEVGPAVNRDLARRIRPVVGLAIDKRIVRNDIKLAVKIIANLDSRWGLWVKDGGASGASQDMFGLTSNNPLLANVTDYLIEEASAEEEELLGKSGEDGEVGDEGETVVRDEELISVLDNLILYLRIVHSIDFYNHSEYPYEDEMPNRCGMLHARGTHPDGPAQHGEIQAYITDFEKKIGGFMVPKQDLGDEDIMKLGAKNEEDEVNKFVAVNTQELGKDKWLCPLSGKKFKGPEFIKKHIENKHGEQLDEVKKEVQYFNNYLRDPKRPQLPENPKSGGGRGSGARPDSRGSHRRGGDPYSYSGAPRDATNYPVYRDREREGRGPQGGRGVRDRLGYGAVRVTHSGADPRAIIDYSDVDNVGNGDYF